MIRLLIADDSALMRKLLEGIFRDEGDFDIQLARHGAEALDLVRSFDPHVVTLDVRMPGMDGLSCLSQIMIQAPRPVVMVSSLTGEGADATLEAIELGAVDFIAKPDGTVSLEIDRLRPVLLTDLGHSVTEASSALEALHILETDPQFDLLVTDYAMPGMTGLDLATKVRKLRPRLPIIIATGYAELPSNAPGGFLRLDKPYTQEQLSEMIGIAASGVVRIHDLRD